MKKILITAFALALPALASAQTQLIAGYNFGQFLGSGPAVLDATTFADAGSIGSNFHFTSQAPSSSSGNNVSANGEAGDFSNGYGRIFWDGTNGSTTTTAANLFVTETGANSINNQTVHAYNMALQGDETGLALTVVSKTISFLTNTTGYADFTPGAGALKNLSFAAQSSAGATINWSLLGGPAIASTTIAAGSNFATYSVDLPAEFYGVAVAQLTAAVSGTATFDNVQFNGVVSAIPEPSTYAAMLGALTIGVVAIRRRKNVVA